MMNSKLLFLICLALLSGCGSPPEAETEPIREPPFIDIGDGARVSARGVLYSAGELATDREVVIYYTHPETGSESMRVLKRYWDDHRVEVDPMSVHLQKDRVILNDEILTRDERLEKFSRYAEAAKLSGSMPVLVIFADSDTPGTILVGIFRELRRSGLNQIIAPFHLENP